MTSDYFEFDSQENYFSEDAFEETPEDFEIETEENDGTDGYETSPVDGTQESNSRRSGSSLDSLYEDWKTAPSEESITALLDDCRDFVVRFIHKKSPANPHVEDIAQLTLLKVWREISKTDFYVRERFTSFVAVVAKRTMLDKVRQDARRNEIELQDWAAYSQSGCSQSSISNSDDANDAPSSGKQPLLSWDEKNAAETGLTIQLDLDRVIQTLSAREQKMIDLIRFGFSSEEIAKELGCKVGQIYNRKQQLRLKLKTALEIDFPIVVHTCQLQFESVSVKKEELSNFGAGRYVEKENGTYRRLPDICRCRKTITRQEAKHLLDRGEVESVLVVRKEKVVEDSKAVWAAQAVRVPRVGRTGKPQMERFAAGCQRDVDDLEIGHQMDVAMLQKLIVPFRPDDWEGRPLFTSFADQQTEGGHAVVAHDSEPRKIDPAVIVESGAHCPSCHKKHCIVSMYGDGSRRFDSACGYLQVLKPRKPAKLGKLITFKNSLMKVPPASVLALKDNPSATANSVTI